MDHAPFIIGAYGVSAVVLLWCALAPLARARRFRTDLLKSLERDGTQGDKGA